MRVLTVRQPWAWAIIHGGKDVENRTRNLAGDYRGPVAIHAGLAVPDRNYRASRAVRRGQGTQTPEELVFGAIIGVVDLTGVHTDDQCLHNVGQYADDSEDDAWCSDWAEHSSLVKVHHLELANPRPLKDPILYTGALGLRTLGPDITKQIELALAGGTA